MEFEEKYGYSMAKVLNDISEYIYTNNHKVGWWTAKDGTALQDNPLSFPNKLMLVVSEVAEAMEGDRKGLQDDHLPQRPMREVELADAFIRIADMCRAYNLDLGGATAEKLEYNKTRADHKMEARTAAGGKTY